MKETFCLKDSDGNPKSFVWNNNQKNYFNTLVNNKNVLYLKKEKVGETTMTAFYLLYMAMKNHRYKIQIRTHKAAYANFLFKLMKAIYFSNKDDLPKAKMIDSEVNNARKELIFDNGSRISYIRFFKRLPGKPVSILYVSDLSKFEKGREVPYFEKELMYTLIKDNNIKVILVKTKPKTPRKNNKNDFFDRLWRKHNRKELNIFHMLEDRF